MDKDINMKDAFTSERKVRATLKSSYVVHRGEKYNPVNMKSIVRVSNISTFASREEDAERIDEETTSASERTISFSKMYSSFQCS